MFLWSNLIPALLLSQSVMIQKVSTNNDIFYMLATFVVHEYYAHSKECKLAISLVHLKGKLGDRLENFQSLDRFIERLLVLG